MPVVKERFSLKSEDIDRLQNSLINFQGDKENAINECLQKIISPKVTKSITNCLPMSKKGKNHAKNSEWYEVEFYNMSFVLSNSLKGKRGTSFYYLYYPATGTGNSKKKGPNDFFNRGFDREYNNVIDDLLTALNVKIEEEFK